MFRIIDFRVFNIKIIMNKYEFLENKRLLAEIIEIGRSGNYERFEKRAGILLAI